MILKGGCHPEGHLLVPLRLRSFPAHCNIGVFVYFRLVRIQLASATSVHRASPSLGFRKVTWPSYVQQSGIASQSAPAMDQQATAAVICRIEDMVESIVDALTDNRPMAIPLRSRSSGNEVAVSFPSATGTRRFSGFPRQFRVLLLPPLFPAYICVGDAQRRPCIFCSFAVKRSSVVTSSRKGTVSSYPLVRGGISSNAVRNYGECLVRCLLTTCRNIYYQNPELFQSQDYVDRLIDDIAYTFGVGRSALNIVS